MKKLNNEQRQLVESHHLLTMKIVNSYWSSNRDVIETKKLTKMDLEQIALEQLCNIALKSDNIKYEFSTYLCSVLHREIGRVINNYNIIKIPRRDNWNTSDEADVKILNSISRHGISELDRPMNTSSDTDDEVLRVDTLHDDAFESTIDEILLEETLCTHLGHSMARAIVLQLQGYSLKEIANILNLKQSTLRNRLYGAKDTIKKLSTKDGLFLAI